MEPCFGCRAAVGRTIAVEVLSDTALEAYTYVIIGRGDVLASETVAAPNVRRHEFKFTASIAMVPEAHIIVYRVVAGELQSAAETLVMRSGLQNTVC